MNRKIYFLLSFVFALIMRLHMNVEGRIEDSLPSLILHVPLMAFLAPVALPVQLIEKHVFGFDPWNGPGHWLVSFVANFAAAGLVWFFPCESVSRWFGTCDVFIRTTWRHRTRTFTEGQPL